MATNTPEDQTNSDNRVAAVAAAAAAAAVAATAPTAAAPDRRAQIISAIAFSAVALVSLDAEEHRFLRARHRFGAGRRQVNLDIHSGQRCCHHKDDQQYQHHVDKRGDVDFMVLGEIVIAFF